MRGLLQITTAFILLMAAGCHKDKPGPVVVSAAKGVYVINQGNFGFGNAEISFYNPATQQIADSLFKKVNNYMLGDVAQSMFIRDSLGFIVVNYSQKIEVVKIPSFQHVITITIPNASPRYFLPVNDSVAYVSELYKGEIHVVNYLTGALLTNITGVAQWTEHMILTGNTVVVEEQNFNDSTVGSLAVLNTQNNSFVQRFSYAGGNVQDIVKDNQNHIWLAMDEDSAANIPASLYCLNSDMSIHKRLQFAMGHHPWFLSVDGSGSRLYYFDTDIYSLSVNSDSVPATPFAAGNGRNFYALGVDPANGDVYAGDALDYVQPSNIYRYSQTGSLIQSFRAGVITGNFTFNE
jgi:hypothetical protein